MRKFITLLLTITILTPAWAQQKKAKNIILMIGDGMGMAQIYAGLTAKKGKPALERCQYIGLSKTNSADNYITDSAAGATAFATGKKTYNGAIAVDMQKQPLETILEKAEKNGLATGLVATCSITHATPASFIAHQPSRNMHEAIAADFLKTDIDVFIGGGRKFFEKREDKKDLIKALKKNKYQLPNNLEELAKIKKGKIAALLYEEHPPRMLDNRGEMLAKSTQKALEILNQNEDGFFLMIEGSQIDWGGHANESDYIVTEMVDFDNVINQVLDFVDQNGETLLVITADHETGGYGLNGGDLEKGEVEGAFTTKKHTGVMVPVFAYGIGAENFIGIYHNHTLFNKMLAAWKM
ncbi:MAG: alkaline phosphatase [Thermonemataceae bacterium]